MTGRRTARSQSKPRPSVRSRQPRKPRRSEAKLAFEALTIEGGLLSPDWLARVAAVEAASQGEADYRIPKGLQLRDEIGRYWRIAQAYWNDFAAGRSSAIKTEAAQALSERFVLALLRESFGFSSLAATEPLVIAERRYPVGFTALSGRVPVLIAPAGSGLDTLAPAFGDGGRRRSAFGLAQEYLNAAESATWGLATDGLTLRILRDNASLTRPAWIEVDLARIFTEKRYADFAALWLLAHETRFGRADQSSTECALETWRDAGREEGTRAREHLRRGVEEALVALGQGFLALPENTALRTALQDGSLSTNAYFQELLRLVYRLIFLLTVEERGLLHPEGSAEGARRLYEEGYGLRRLRERSIRRSAHDRFSDLWEATKIVFRSLATGESRLALPALAGLFASTQCQTLDATKLENRALLLAIFHLSWLRETSGLVRVNWRDMGPEELGSVYESLLELVPQVIQDGWQFVFAVGGETRGHARKTTGSYYTPDSLVQELLDGALEPVIADTITKYPEKPMEALLGLSIVDPACGSGHFLLAAARRIASHVARLEAKGTPSASEYRHALRQVVGRCIYGVDINPMAVELCKVSLWMEAVEPGLPLTFLNSHVQQGNSLLGTTPELMTDGVPDIAWEPIEGDDKETARALKKRNKKAAARQRSLDTLWSIHADAETQAMASAVAALEAASDANYEALARKEIQWADILGSIEYQHKKFLADAWCAAFVWPKQPGELAKAAPTNDLWSQFREGHEIPSALSVKTVSELTEQYSFFHWHLQFPQVFAKGGFDVVLGNPPWDQLQLDAREWFASRDSRITEARHHADRLKAINQLRDDDLILYAKFGAAKRLNAGAQALVHNTGHYPLTSNGRLNTAPLFAELAVTMSRDFGLVGLVVPTGIATDSFTQSFFRYLVDSWRLHALLSFENEEFLFPSVHHATKFCLLVIGGSQRRKPEVTLTFFARRIADIRDPNRRVTLSVQDFHRFNPNTHTCPTFRSQRDADINVSIYQIAGVLDVDGPSRIDSWGFRSFLMFMTNVDSHLFRTSTELELDGGTWLGNQVLLGEELFVPFTEAKMLHHFDHRFGTYRGQTEQQANQGKLPELAEVAHAEPTTLTLPRHWIREAEVEARLSGKWDRQWLLGWRDICRSTDQRTLIASLLPRVATAETFILALPSLEPNLVAALYANFCSFVLDYAARQKVGGTHLRYHVARQLPTLPPSFYDRTASWNSDIRVRDWLLPRVVELTYTAWDLEPFARDVGYDCPPFRWDSKRRFLLRCELDAAFLHLYGLPRDDAAYILDTFPIVRKTDEKAHGEYRTKRVILEIYEAMAEATRTGQPYVTRLAPPPADPRVAHPSDPTRERKMESAT